MVAIGDVHGDFDDFVALLQKAGLIDAQHHWTGGKATFVQVGDLIDRGPKPREVMDLMMALENEAPKSGGRVVSLLGNHEVMNIMGDLRYVTPENFASFANGSSEERRKAAYQAYAKWRIGHAELIADLPQPVLEVTEAEWMARHPAGYVEQREAFAPKGNYGKWLRDHVAVTKIDTTIFLHGGLSPSLNSLDLDTINSHIRDEIKEFDAVKESLVRDGVILPFFNFQQVIAVGQAEVIAERKGHVPTNEQRQAELLKFLRLEQWLSIRQDGPLWFRGYDQWTNEEGGPQIAGVLQAHKASHVVVGHTVQRGHNIRALFGGKVFLIDTGMLSSYYPGGQPSALEIQDAAKFTAEYMNQRVLLVGPENPATPKPAAASDPPPPRP